MKRSPFHLQNIDGLSNGLIWGRGVHAHAYTFDIQFISLHNVILSSASIQNSWF